MSIRSILAIGFRQIVYIFSCLFCAGAFGAAANDSLFIPVRGSLNAPVSIMIFSDFSCVYCAKATATLNEIERLYPGEVIIVFKHFPLRLDDSTLLPHEASIAAGQQGKFWLMHDVLFEIQGKHQRPSLDRKAKELHLNLSRFKKDLDKHSFRDAVLKDVIEAKALKVTATPTFFIDGYKLEGLQSLSALQQIIENRLRAKSAQKYESSSLQQFLKNAYETNEGKLINPHQAPDNVTVSRQK
jgi:protein-disulfide isomerase